MSFNPVTLDPKHHVPVGHGHHVPVGHHHVPFGHGHHVPVGHGHHHVPVGHHVGYIPAPSSTVIFAGSGGGGTWIGRKMNLLIAVGSLAIISGLVIGILGLFEGMKNPPSGIFCLSLSAILVVGGVACITALIAKKYIK